MSNIFVMGCLGGRSPPVMPNLSQKSSSLVQFVGIGCASWSSKKNSKVSLYGEVFSQKVKKCKHLSKIHFFEILIVFDLFWSTSDPRTSKFGPVLLYSALQRIHLKFYHWAPFRQFLTAFIPPSAAAHLALPKSDGAEGAQKKGETLSYPTGYVRASNSFQIREYKRLKFEPVHFSNKTQKKKSPVVKGLKRICFMGSEALLMQNQFLLL